MIFELHPDAIANFNEKANALLFDLTFDTYAQNINTATNFKHDIHIASTISDKDIVDEMKYGRVDVYGNEVCKYFSVGDRLLGLQDDAFLKLKRLAESMQKIKSLSERVSIQLLIDTIFDWIKNKYKNRTNETMVNYVLEICSEKLVEIELWFPIAEFFIQSEIKLGKITFKTISREMIDESLEDMKVRNPDHQDKVTQLYEKRRGTLQGYAAATIKLYAELERAYEIGREEAETAISLLRIFSLANFDPQIISYCTLLGKEKIESKYHFTVRNGLIQHTTEGFIYSGQKHWCLDAAFFSIIKPCIDVLNDLLMTNELNEFQGKAFDALLLYSKSSLAKTASDKVIYILTALEFILLKNETEPITQNIAERMALFISDKVGERRSIISRVKKVYDLRSKFIHHGQNIDDLKILKEFMFDAYQFFQNLILNINKCKTKEQFINKFEEMKLT